MKDSLWWALLAPVLYGLMVIAAILTAGVLAFLIGATLRDHFGERYFNILTGAGVAFAVAAVIVVGVFRNDHRRAGVTLSWWLGVAMIGFATWFWHPRTIVDRAEWRVIEQFFPRYECAPYPSPCPINRTALEIAQMELRAVEARYNSHWPPLHFVLLSILTSAAFVGAIIATIALRRAIRLEAKQRTPSRP